MVSKITSLVLMFLALLSLQFGPATMAYASMKPNTVSLVHSTQHPLSLSTHHFNVSKVVAHHHDMSGQCCVSHMGVCDMALASERLAFYEGRDGQRICFNDVVQGLPSFLVPAALRPPISFFA